MLAERGVEVDSSAVYRWVMTSELGCEVVPSNPTLLLKARMPLAMSGTRILGQVYPNRRDG